MKSADRGPQPTRRRFLKRGIGGAMLLGVGALCAYQVHGYTASSEELAELFVLDAKELTIVRALLDSFLEADDDEGPEWPSHEEVRTVFRFDEMLARLDDANRRDLRLLLHSLEHVIPPMTGHVSRFSRLDRTERSAVLAAMESHPLGLIRGAFAALKGLVSMSYFSADATWGALGYDGPLVGRPPEGWVAAAQLRRRRR